jgi:radical SAM protein (TIGR04043 family)
MPEPLRTGRKGGAGPAGGRYIIVENTLVNVPVYGAAVTSPFSITERQDSYVLNDTYETTILEDPHFYHLHTEDGISYKKIALLHGVNCLATTVYQKCIRWRKNPCLFCGIELSLGYGATVERKTPEQLAAVAEAARSEGALHGTLTTGTPNDIDRGAEILAESAAALKRIGLPVHVQIEPVQRRYIELLKEAGADTIGIHIETLDEQIFKRMCPGKHFSEYECAWKEALEIFGEPQVSSYVLVGLGEDHTKMIEGIEAMVQTGVIPYVVPFRPIAGSVLEKWELPPFDTVKACAVYAAQKMREYGVDPFKNKAGCVRCGACSPVKDYLTTL